MAIMTVIGIVGAVRRGYDPNYHCKGRALAGADAFSNGDRLKSFYIL